MLKVLQRVELGLVQEAEEHEQLRQAVLQWRAGQQHAQLRAQVRQRLRSAQRVVILGFMIRVQGWSCLIAFTGVPIGSTRSCVRRSASDCAAHRML